MANRFINYNSGSSNSSSNVRVNNIKTNGLGKIVLNLGNLNGVTISTPSNAQQLIYDSTSQKWINKTPAMFTTSLSALNDCSISLPIFTYK